MEATLSQRDGCESPPFWPGKPPWRCAPLIYAYLTYPILRTAAQNAVEVAVAAAEVTAAERAFRAIEELIPFPAVIRAIGSAGEKFSAAMVAKPPGERVRILPVGEHDRRSGRPDRPRGRGSRCQADQSEQRERSCHHSVIATASLGIPSPLTASTPHGKRTKKREPAPSSLSTVTLPRCRSSASLTR